MYVDLPMQAERLFLGFEPRHPGHKATTLPLCQDSSSEIIIRHYKYKIVVEPFHDAREKWRTSSWTSLSPSFSAFVVTVNAIEV